MRKIVIPQPWASMIAAGLIDIFDLGVDLGTKQCRVLIVAAPWQKYDNRKNLPLEWVQALSEALLLGMIPLYEEMPFDCVIGIVKASKLCTELDSVWAYGGKRNTLYLLTDARMFVKPLRTSIKNEQDLPSTCKAFGLRPLRIDKTAMIPVNHRVFEEAREGYRFQAPMTAAFAEVIYGRVPGDILEELVITHDHCYKKFVFEPENDFFLAKDEKGRNKRYFSIVSNKTEVRTYYQFNLLNQL